MIGGHVGLDIRFMGLGHARVGSKKGPYCLNFEISGLGFASHGSD
jgi:hypothetical protein